MRGGGRLSQTPPGHWFILCGSDGPSPGGLPLESQRPPLASQAGWKCQGMPNPHSCPTGRVILGRMLYATSQASHRICSLGSKAKGIIICIFYLPSSHLMHFSSVPFFFFPPLIHPYFPFLYLLRGEW